MYSFIFNLWLLQKYLNEFEILKYLIKTFYMQFLVISYYLFNRILNEKNETICILIKVDNLIVTFETFFID